MGLGIRRAPIDCQCIEGCRHWTKPFKHYWVSSASLYGFYHEDFVLYRFSAFYPPSCEWVAVQGHFPVPRVELLRKTPIADGGGNIIGFRWTLINTSGAGPLNSWSVPVVPGEYTAYPVEHEGWGSCDKLTYNLPHDVLGPAFSAVIQAGYPDACDDADFPAKVQTKPFTWQP